ncbi:VCBS repeat-containing protein [Candidatus Woesearchaeota archaeon]|nr:VCBS repeat-containing protein [Candidatus Woesearchaeota archaeon]
MVLILNKKRDGRIVLFSVFIFLVGSILFASAVSVNNNQTKPIINDIVAVDKFNHLKGFKQIGFTIGYDNIAIESFNKEILSSSEKKLKNKFSFQNVEVQSVYEEIDTSFFNTDERPVKQTYILKNLLNTKKNIKLNILYEIDSDFVVWNGTEYTISNEPIRFNVFEVTEEIIPGLNETYLTGHTLYFGNNYYDFKDVIGLNYTVFVYSLNGKNYISLEINKEIDSLGEFVIDPVIGWTTHVISSLENGAHSVFAIDMDEDNDIDVISAAVNNNEILWHENNGSSPPGWTRRTIDTTANGPRSVYAIDVDNDTDLDVVASSNNRVTFYENNGSSPPGWTRQFIYANIDIVYYSVFAIDVNNDSNIDVLSAHGNDDEIAWYQNDGSSPPNWTKHIISTSANRASSVYAIDIDNDNDIDVLSASQVDDKIAWYENDGGSNPSWTARNITTSANEARSVYAIDIDKDNDIDVISASSLDNTIAWYENNGSSPPSWTARNISTSASGAFSVFAIDIDKDNDNDVLSASGSIAWYENNGSSQPGWTTHNISTACNNAKSVFAIDIDNDNDIDALSACFNDNSINWYESNLTPPNSTDLEILEVIPIQVVRDVDMVKGKSGIVRVVVI